MTVDLWILIATCALALFIVLGPLMVAMRNQYGLPALLGNREELAPLEGWSGRLSRAYRNLMDNLPIFGTAVLTAHIVGASNEASAMGAQIFFISRIVHVISYTFGIKFIRTLSFMTSIAGIVMIALQLL